jgi:hypothetical protein
MEGWVGGWMDGWIGEWWIDGIYIYTHIYIYIPYIYSIYISISHWLPSAGIKGMCHHTHTHTHTHAHLFFLLFLPLDQERHGDGALFSQDRQLREIGAKLNHVFDTYSERDMSTLFLATKSRVWWVWWEEGCLLQEQHISSNVRMD